MTRVAVSPAMTEREFQRWVIDQARSFGWGVTLSARKVMLAEAAGYGVEAPPLDGLVFHPQYSLGSEPGWPDLTLIRRRDRRLIFAELKSQKGQLSPRQAEVLGLLRELELEPSGLVRGEAQRPNPSESRMRMLGDLPRIEVHVWRPEDLQAIAETLR